MSKVLIVDDQPAIRKLVYDVLNDKHEILYSSTAEEAINIADEHKPDVILLDLGLPGMDGIAVLPILKNMLPGCRIIILSGIINNSVMKRAISLGASGYIPKPFDILSMKTIIEDISAI